MARGIRRVRPAIELVAVERSVLVAIDADALPLARRDAGERALLPRHLALLAQRAPVGERLRRAIRAERTAREPQPAAVLAGEVALHDEIALAGRGACDQQVDAQVD